MCKLHGSIGLIPRRRSQLGRGTYEFSRLEYVLPVSVTALDGAIRLDYKGGKEEGNVEGKE